MRRWGALNVFAERSDAFDEEAEEIGYVLPPMPHWRGTRRDTTPGSQRIGEPRPHRTGQGILIARFNIDAIRSFALLQRVSQESNTGLVHIARELTIRNRFDDLGDGSRGPLRRSIWPRPPRSDTERYAVALLPPRAPGQLLVGTLSCPLSHPAVVLCKLSVTCGVTQVV